MTDKHEAGGAASAPTPDQLREDAVRAREELGGIAAESGARGHERVAAARRQIDERTAQAKDKAARAFRRVQERTPERFRQQAEEAASAAGRNPGQILAVVSGFVLIYLVVRRTRR
ncbi:hypothetical protein [Streptomyces sp. MI02-7b]|uniref:hypothetical protein n=1 Tax=Streptomyces sp. MI02-7b TaxID=462941 RepID=UPI0029AB7D8B|nr:hypothetical protein [Streptomyces sp. MI02-7b]MDX3076886.1 hypothetical protein [Streptomyces sp. MI02-7b]